MEYPNRSLQPRLKNAIFYCKFFGTKNFRPNFQMCIFRGFYEVCTSQPKACCKNSKFLRGAYLAAYRIDENSDEVSEFTLKFTDLGIYLFRDLFGVAIIVREYPLFLLVIFISTCRYGWVFFTLFFVARATRINFKYNLPLKLF